MSSRSGEAGCSNLRTAILRLDRFLTYFTCFSAEVTQSIPVRSLTDEFRENSTAQSSLFSLRLTSNFFIHFSAACFEQTFVFFSAHS